MNFKQCGNCGQNTMKAELVKGPFPWKDFPSVVLMSPVKLLQCSNCGEIAMKPKDTDAVDRAVEATIRTVTGGFIEMILSRESCSQVTLASRIGVTPEYLSGLKTGSRTPGFQTFNFLKIMAEDKTAFVISDPAFELEQFLASLSQDTYDSVLKKLA